MADDGAQQGWAWAEFGDADLGDQRLTRRLTFTADALSRNPEESLPNAFNGDKYQLKAAYRLFDNEAVEPNEILQAHRGATLRRIQEMECDLILAVQDTTQFDFTTHHATTGLGSTGAPGLQGMFLHSTMAVDPVTGVPIGLLDWQQWVREPDPQEQQAFDVEHETNEKSRTKTKRKGKHRRSRKRTIDEKESGRWLAAMTRSADGIPAQVRILAVADREADFFEFADHARTLGRHFLVRANHDRNVVVDGEAKGLWDAAAAAALLGTYQFTVPRDHKHNRPVRQAVAELRVAEVQVRPPKHLAPQHLAPITLRAILLQEIDAPPDQEPVQWLLLTTLPIETLDQAQQCIVWYTFRWRIERFHFTLKSGGNYEKLELHTGERLWRALAVYMVVAWRVLRIDLIARTCPAVPCTAFLTDDEWHVLCCHHLGTAVPPPEPPDARTAVRWIAKLGGFLGRKGDGEPGVKTLWCGFRRLQDLVEGWRLHHARE